MYPKIHNIISLAVFYIISIPTLNIWIKLIPEPEIEPNTRIFTPKKIKIIIIYRGEPPD